jgi:hypothetical protein
MGLCFEMASHVQLAIAGVEMQQARGMVVLCLLKQVLLSVHTIVCL